MRADTLVVSVVNVFLTRQLSVIINIRATNQRKKTWLVPTALTGDCGRGLYKFQKWSFL